MAWKRVFAVAVTAVAALLMVPGSASAQANDAALKRGKSLWQNRGCTTCHAFYKKGAGPDLAGVTQRRSKEWLVSWLKDTEGMLESDSTAKALLVEWNNIRMPAQKFTDADVEAILTFLDAETARLKK
jgi:nitrite reductase (NO-forming)